jgi:hypothetical protein
MVLLGHCMVLNLFAWVELVASLLVPAIILVLGVCCCVCRVLKAKRTACFSFLRQKVSVPSWKTLYTLRAGREGDFLFLFEDSFKDSFLPNCRSCSKC